MKQSKLTYMDCIVKQSVGMGIGHKKVPWPGDWREYLRYLSRLCGNVYRSTSIPGHMNGFSGGVLHRLNVPLFKRPGPMYCLWYALGKRRLWLVTKERNRLLNVSDITRDFPGA